MSCGCNNNSNACPEVPYPQMSTESVPSLIENLVYALYGTINKSVVNGRVVWDIPCDPNNTAEIDSIPREEGEGLLCYLIRLFADTFGAGSPFPRWGFAGSGQTSFVLTGANLGSKNGYLVYIDGVVQDPLNFTVTGYPNPTLTLSEPVLVGSYITIIQLQVSGATGATGPAGSPGGATGATGPQGAQGATGAIPPTNAGFIARYTGNGTQTNFAFTGSTSTNAGNFLVAIDGIVQDPQNYSVSSGNIVMSAPVPNGSVIVIVTLSSL